jgi:hypothetical protein
LNKGIESRRFEVQGRNDKENNMLRQSSLACGRSWLALIVASASAQLPSGNLPGQTKTADDPPVPAVDRKFSWRQTGTSIALLNHGRLVWENKNSYGGMAIRMAAECCGDAAAERPPWTFLDSEGRANCNNQKARWVAYSGTTPSGQSAAVAMFHHPDNPMPAFTQATDFSRIGHGHGTIVISVLLNRGVIGYSYPLRSVFWRLCVPVEFRTLIVVPS